MHLEEGRFVCLPARGMPRRAVLAMHGHGQGGEGGIRTIHPCQGQYGAWVFTRGAGALEKSSMHGCPPGRSGEMGKIEGRRN